MHVWLVRPAPVRLRRLAPWVRPGLLVVLQDPSVNCAPRLDPCVNS